MKYDPDDGPHPESWLNLDESERLEAVLRYHKRAKFRAGSLRGHAIIHTVVENQLAEGYGATVTALQRLQTEGLDRHEAVHAIGSVLAGHLNEAVQSGDAAFDARAYDTALAELTAAAWRRLANSD
jgi:hypothetical protein